VWTICPKLIDLIGDSFQALLNNAMLIAKGFTRFAPFPSAPITGWIDVSPSQYFLISPE
jgi:hypothetical protein